MAADSDSALAVSLCPQAAAMAENDDNIAEQKRQDGKRVRYGEVIQVSQKHGVSGCVGLLVAWFPACTLGMAQSMTSSDHLWKPCREGPVRLFLNVVHATL